MTTRDSAASSTFMGKIPEGPEYDPIRYAIQRIAETFPDELAEISEARIQAWIDEVDRGDARSADDIRDDIFRVVVGRDTIMDVLGVTAEEADALIKGGNDGGMNFSDLNIVSGPGGSVVAESDPAGILEGGVFTVVKSRDADMPDRYAMVYKVGDIEHLYFFDSLESAASILGDPYAMGSATMMEDEINDSDTYVIGSAEGLGGAEEGSYTGYYARIVDEAAISAGVTDPTKLGRLMQDPAVQAIMARAQLGGYADNEIRIKAEIRNESTAYYEIYPGIDELIKSGSTDPEADWARYKRDVTDSLKAVGYEPDADGSYDSKIGDMLSRGITADEFNTFAPTYARAVDSPGFASALNEWVQADTGTAMTFEEWFDVLEGTSTPEMDAIVEKATLQFQADLATTSLSADQISRLAELTQLSEQQMTLAFSQAEEALLSVGDADLERYGLSQQQLVNAAFGVDTDGRSATDVNRQARKAATELGIQDDAKQGFFLGFDRLSRPVRQGLTAARPERG